MQSLNCTVFGILAIIAILFAILIIVKIKTQIGFLAKSYQPFVFWISTFVLILALLAVILSATMIGIETLNAKTTVEKYKEETTTTLLNSHKTISDAIDEDAVEKCVDDVKRIVKTDAPFNAMVNKFSFDEVKEKHQDAKRQLEDRNDLFSDVSQVFYNLKCNTLSDTTRNAMKTIGETLYNMDQSIKSDLFGKLINTIDESVTKIKKELRKIYFDDDEIDSSLLEPMTEDLEALKEKITKMIEFDEKPTRIMFIIFLVVYGIYSSASIITTSIAIVGCVKWFRKRSEPTKLMTYPVYAMVLLLFLTSITFLFFYLEIIEDLNICGVQQNDQIFFDSVCPSSNATFFSTPKSTNSFSSKAVGEILKFDRLSFEFSFRLQNSLKSIVIPDDLRSNYDTIGKLANDLSKVKNDCTFNKDYITYLDRLHTLLEKNWLLKKSLVDINKANFVCNHIYEYGQGICILAGDILDIYTTSVYLLLMAQLFSILANSFFCMMAECWKKHDEMLKENSRKEKERIEKLEKEAVERIKEKKAKLGTPLQFSDQNQQLDEKLKERSIVFPLLFIV
ncbi:unnamed protein product [Caenorhabditis angaria]|uniref:Uncharacterized protein n=1 Tax=Caenorhabditis angaria TaxID=860376 RepID=A0A9P1I7T2_9PELO|nr:unnamed protein product [Caenorhabditis angaria]